MLLIVFSSNENDILNKDLFACVRAYVCSRACLDPYIKTFKRDWYQNAFKAGNNCLEELSWSLAPEALQKWGMPMG